MKTADERALEVVSECVFSVETEDGAYYEAVNSDVLRRAIRDAIGIAVAETLREYNAALEEIDRRWRGGN